MKLNDQVTTLDQSKALNNFGIKSNPDTYLFWVEFNDGIFVLCREGSKYEEAEEIMWMIAGETPPELEQDLNDGNCNAIGMVYAAFTVSELSQMLPYSLKDAKGIEYISSTTKDFDHYSQSCSYTWGYYNFDKRDWYYGVGEISPVKAAGDLLIRLLEHGKVTPEQIKNNVQ